MIKGAIFDLDGTLLDSMGIWDGVGVNYLRSLGYEPEEGLNERLTLMSLTQAAECFRSEYGVPRSVEEICGDINGRIEGFYRYEAELKPGAAGFLRRLRQAGVKLCIATATDEYLVRAALERCGVLDCFSAVYTCTGVGSGKDQPLIYRAALEHLGTERRETVVFEDAYYALETAKADGFITAAVFDSHEPRPEELRDLAEYFIEDYSNCEEFWKFALA